MSDKKSGTLKNVLSIFVITLVAVLLLAVVNQITEKPIEQAELDAQNKVYQAVFTDAKEFAEVSSADEIAKNSEAVLKEASITTCTINNVMQAKDGNTSLGYVIDSTSKSGYGGDVQIAVGIDNDGKITGFSVIKAAGESPGLGSNAKDDPAFAEQFKGLAAETIEYVKGGGATGNQIDAISGATITTNAVTEATNAAIAYYNTCLKGE